ncbi:MAG: hypothetical protein GX458_06700, partial [Phyllobacteriaceae bacterium]|nr:hypothetical protein [Phyllobacteriaceae bacterium]
MAHDELSHDADTTIDLGRLRAALGAAHRPALAIGLAVGLVAGGLAALRDTPVAVESRVLVEPLAATRIAADEDRTVAAQIGLLRADDFLRRVAASRSTDGEGSDRVVIERAERDLAALQSGFTVERVERSRILALRLATSDEAEGRRLLAALRERWSAALAETRARAEGEVDRRFAAEIDAAERRLAPPETDAAAAPTDPAAADLDALRAERVEAETVLARLRDFAGEGSKGVERAVDAAPTAGLQDLRRKRAVLRSRLAELSITYLANHPLMKQVGADLDDLRAQMRAELPRAVATAAARLADVDRRLAERAVETTASIPPAAPTDELAGPRAVLSAAIARRDAARRVAVERVGVMVRSLGDAEVETSASPIFVAAVGSGGGFVAFLFGLIGLAGRRLCAVPASPEGRARAAQVAPAPV